MAVFSGKRMKDHDEKRAFPRYSLEEGPETMLSYQGTVYASFMMNVSEMGAMFRISDETLALELPDNETVEVEISTPYGPARCSGRVAWSLHMDGKYTWGVEFKEKFGDKEGPLAKLISTLPEE